MARFLIDANLPRLFRPWNGPDYLFVEDIGRSWTDREIWAFALARTLTIVTKDGDFTHRAMQTRHGPRLIHLRTGNLTLRGFYQHVAPRWDAVCEASLRHAMVIVHRDLIETVA